ncbi:archease [Thermodesulfobacteriota bacterium]
MTHHLIDHTADFGIYVFGSDEKDLFANAALAMFDLITDLDKVAGSLKHAMQVTGEDWPDLMVNWLRELLFLWAGREMLAKKVEIQYISEKKLSASVHCDPFDADRHLIKNEIKAVTYHQIQVKAGPEGWESQIIFDC